MSIENTFLTYCVYNQKTIDKIFSDLSPYGASFTLDLRKDSDQEKTKRMMRAQKNPVLIFISNEFLSSSESMNKVLSFIQDADIAPYINPIIIGPLKEDKSYIDFWTSEYATLRARKDNISPLEMETYNWRVFVIRRISNIIEPFLNHLRTMNFSTLEEFQSDNYNDFFRLHRVEIAPELDSVKFEVPPPIKIDEVVVDPDIASVEMDGVPFIDDMVPPVGGNLVEETEHVLENIFSPDEKKDKKPKSTKKKVEDIETLETSQELQSEPELKEENEEPKENEKTNQNDALFTSKSKSIKEVKKNTKKGTMKKIGAKKEKSKKIKIPKKKIKTIQKKSKRRKPTDSRVLITGATAGIGLAIAQKFASEGYNLIITGRRKKRLTEIETKLEAKYKVKVKTLCFDVQNIKEVIKSMSKLEKTPKRVDILINNAGLAKGLDVFHEASVDHWETMIDTNVKGLLYMTRTIAPQMVARGSGHIINIGSVAGKEVYPKGAVYCATKHAVEALTKSIRMDLLPYNVKVSSVSPGHVETEFSLVRFDGDSQKAGSMYDGFDPLKANDVAETVFFVAAQPPNVNIQDVLMFSSQQASAVIIDRKKKQYNG